MKQVAPNAYALGSSGHNFYLLVEDDEVTMVDAGCSGEWDQLVAALDGMGLSLDAVSGVIATHSHADHFGLAHQLQSEGIEVKVHRDEERRALGTYTGQYAVKPTQLPVYSLRTWRNFLPMMRAGVMRLRHLETVSTFSHLDQLDLPGRPVAHHTPGHTEGHAMFHIADAGILFTGDGLVTMDVLGTSTGPQMMDHRFNNDHVAAWRSLERIVEINADLLLPGHGSPWQSSPAHAIDRARTRAER